MLVIANELQYFTVATSDQKEGEYIEGLPIENLTISYWVLIYI